MVNAGENEARKKDAIRSLRDDVRAMSTRNMDVRMVAMSRRERVVAHDITDESFLLPVMTCCRTFFEENSSIMFFEL